jgi:hypothetical protein
MKAMPPRKPTAIVQLKVRLREDLRRRLEREADRRDDSINNEIVRRLEGSFQRDADLGVAAEVRALRGEVEELRGLSKEELEALKEEVVKAVRETIKKGTLKESEDERKTK